MALQVSDKSAIVTGAGSGINLAFAKLLLEAHCNVIFADLSLRPEAQALIEAYSSKTSDKPHAIFHKTDVTDWTQLNSLFTTAEQSFGPISLVCPGAGVYEPTFSNFWIPPGDPTSADKIDGSRYASLDINLTHPIRCTQLAIAHFSKHKIDGVVVHISSIAAQRPFFANPLYAAAKSGVSNFVRSLGMLENPPKESGMPKIRVVAVAPGIIKTPLWTENKEKLAWLDEEQDEWVTPEEVAEVMLRTVREGEFVGGSVVEVGKGQTRMVEIYNDAGPSGAGHTVSGYMKGIESSWERVSKEGWGLGKGEH